MTDDYHRFWIDAMQSYSRFANGPVQDSIDAIMEGKNDLTDDEKREAVLIQAARALRRLDHDRP